MSSYTFPSRSKRFFDKVFAGACDDPDADDDDIKTRTGIFDFSEQALCKAQQKYIFPKKAVNVQGRTVTIVNTEEYKQGVTVENCLSVVRGTI